MLSMLLALVSYSFFLFESVCLEAKSFKYAIRESMCFLLCSLDTGFVFKNSLASNMLGLNVWIQLAETIGRVKAETDEEINNIFLNLFFIIPL